MVDIMKYVSKVLKHAYSNLHFLAVHATDLKPPLSREEGERGGINNNGVI